MLSLVSRRAPFLVLSTSFFNLHLCLDWYSVPTSLTDDTHLLQPCYFSYWPCRHASLRWRPGWHTLSDMTSHISKMATSSTVLKGHWKKSRPFQIQNTANAIIQCISSFLDWTSNNSNSTLWGLPAERLNRVQKMQNAAARVLARINSTDRNHYTSPAVPALISICKQNQYKILTVTYLCGPGNAPQYLRELVSP